MNKKKCCEELGKYFTERGYVFHCEPFDRYQYIDSIVVYFSFFVEKCGGNNKFFENVEKCHNWMLEHIEPFLLDNRIFVVRMTYDSKNYGIDPRQKIYKFNKDIKKFEYINDLKIEVW